MKNMEKMSIEYIMSLGFTKEEAEGVYETQNYQPPSDFQEAAIHAQQWSSYDKLMGGLDADLATGRINQDEYFTKQAEFSAAAYKRKL